MSNFSDIGFGVQDREAFKQLINDVCSRGRHIPVNEEAYILFTDPSGAELWTQLDKDNKILGVNPHFNGKTKRIVSITAPIKRSSSILTGAYHAWAAPTDESNPESGEYPFVFDVPDAKTINLQSLPCTREIQLTAFAQDIDVYANEDEYDASQPTEIKFAPQSFIPSGLFTHDDSGQEAASECMFAGFIREYKLLENNFTRHKFYWILLAACRHSWR